MAIVKILWLQLLVSLHYFSMRCNLSLFKFSNHLQDRMELLLDKKKTDELALEEIAELEAIGELDRIFTHMNAMLIAQNANP